VPDSTETPVPSPARRLAFGALKAIYQGGFADTVLHRYLQRTPLIGADRALATELVYGIVRRQRTLDALIDQLGTKKARQQPLDLRIILHLGLYQLRYLSQIPPSAAVNTSVELAKTVGLTRLAGVVNGILRQYLRQQEAGPDPLQLPSEPIGAIAVAHSYPDWLVTLWREWLGDDEAAASGRLDESTAHFGFAHPFPAGHGGTGGSRLAGSRHDYPTVGTAPPCPPVGKSCGGHPRPAWLSGRMVDGAGRQCPMG
jgi:transcription termination factor NusB